jgi:hypothetical protein
LLYPLKELCTEDGGGGQHHVPAVLSPEKTRYPLYRRLGGAPRPVWSGAQNLALTGIRFPDPTAHSESLNRLSYPGRNESHAKANTLQRDMQGYSQSPGTFHKIGTF